MNNRKSGVLLSYALMIFEVLSTLLITPYIISSLGQAEYGVYKLVGNVNAYLMLLDLGVGNAIVRYVSLYLAEKNKVRERQFFGIAILYYATIAIITIILGIALVFCFPSLFAKGLSPKEIRLGQVLLGITILNSALVLGTAVYQNVIIAYENFVVSKGLSIIQIILRMGLTVGALYFGFGSMGIVIVNLITSFVARLYSLLYVFFRLKLKPLFKGVTFPYIKEIVIYSTFIFFQMIATQINQTVGTLLLGMAVTSSSVIIGVFSVGTQISQYFQSIGSAFGGVLMPGVVRLTEANASSDIICLEMIRIGRMVFMVLGAILVGFLAFGEQFVTLWAGRDNSEAYFVALILMSAYLFVQVESVGTQILWAKNQHQEQAILKLLIVVINTILTYVLVMHVDPVLGATLGTGISVFCGDVIVMNYLFHRKLGVSIRKYFFGLFKGILPALVISYAMAMLFYQFVDLQGWGGFATNIMVFCLSYSACMLLFGFNSYEKSLVRSLLRRVRIRMTTML